MIKYFNHNYITRFNYENDAGNSTTPPCEFYQLVTPFEMLWNSFLHNSRFKGTIHSSLWSSHLLFLGSTYINLKCIYEHLRCFITIREGLRSTLVKFYGPRIKGLSSRAIFENRIFSRFSTFLEKALELIPW